MINFINIWIVFNGSMSIFLFSNQLLLQIVNLSVINICIVNLDYVLEVDGTSNREAARNKLSKYTNTISLFNCKFLNYTAF